ncbi:hypothetical protein EJB05_42135, partial [Eragrostis curvula]
MAKVCSRPTPTFVLFCLSYFIFFVHVRHTSALSFNLSFSDPRNPNPATLINIPGRDNDAFFSPNTLELTRNSRNINSTYSTGRAQYTQTMRLWDRTTGEMASFTTTFSFQITPDPSTTTVRYENATELLVVDLRISNTSYRVSATVDLRSYLPEDVAVGFSAATGAAGEQHQILTWSFNSTLEPKTTRMEPAPPPRSSVDDATTSKHRKKAAVPLVAVLVPLLVLVACAAVGLLLWRRHKKRKSNEASDDDQEQDYRAELERGVAASGPRSYTGDSSKPSSDSSSTALLGRSKDLA